MIRSHNYKRRWTQVKDFVRDGLDRIHANESLWNSDYTLQLEDVLIKASGKQYASTVASGSHAITIALLANNIGWGNKVIVPNYSCPATLSSINVIGCVPVFCEINQYGSIDVDKLQTLENSGAKAVIATGLYGDVHDHDPVEMFCKQNDMVYVNDAAQSQFALYKGKDSLGLGDVVCMSFADNKPVPVAGTYGAILTDDQILHEKIKVLRKNGKPSRMADYETAGVSSQPEEEKAVQVLASYQHFDAWQKRRHEISDYYDSKFDGKITTRPRPNYSQWNAHKYTIMVEDKFKAYDLLLNEGIETERHYVDNFSKLLWTPNVDEQFDMSDKFIQSSLTIPNNPFMTDEEVEIVSDTILKLLR